MTPFETRILPEAYDALAPDGSEIRLLHSLGKASVVHCRLPAGAVSTPVRHRTVEEVWVILAGAGEVWRRQGNREETLAVAPGTSLTIPLGTHFQFRALGAAPLDILIATSPPWPGEDEAVRLETGCWKA
ncbi:MAG: cupin domain-containing protein [Chloroflexi bacterium]|nr:cupin domain-containing protein [Chloroflexota bacterium]MCY4246908.1 cupin domain-containing protein [Chloroflexota bacterium]